GDLDRAGESLHRYRRRRVAATTVAELPGVVAPPADDRSVAAARARVIAANRDLRDDVELRHPGGRAAGLPRAVAQLSELVGTPAFHRSVSEPSAALSGCGTDLHHAGQTRRHRWPGAPDVDLAERTRSAPAAHGRIGEASARVFPTERQATGRCLTRRGRRRQRDREHRGEPMWSTAAHPLRLLF